MLFSESYYEEIYFLTSLTNKIKGLKKSSILNSKFSSDCFFLSSSYFLIFESSSRYSVDFLSSIFPFMKSFSHHSKSEVN